MSIKEKQFSSTTIKKHNFAPDHWAATLPLDELKPLPEGRPPLFNGIEGCWIPWTLEDKRMAVELNQASGVPTGELFRAMLKRIHKQFTETQGASGNRPSV